MLTCETIANILGSFLTENSDAKSLNVKLQFFIGEILTCVTLACF